MYSKYWWVQKPISHKIHIIFYFHGFFYTLFLPSTLFKLFLLFQCFYDSFYALLLSSQFCCGNKRSSKATNVQKASGHLYTICTVSSQTDQSAVAVNVDYKHQVSLLIIYLPVIIHRKSIEKRSYSNRSQFKGAFLIVFRLTNSGQELLLSICLCHNIK